MGSGVIIISPHDLKQLSSWYYREEKVKNYDFAVVSYHGITSIPNLINFRPAIF
jgi:hypothetical protein